MRKWFTKEYWNQRDVPGLILVLLLGMNIALYFYFPKLLEYITRP